MTKIHLQSQNEDDITFTGPLVINVTFCFGFPPSYKNEKRDRLRGKFHCLRPEIVDLVKYLEDAAFGIILDNDDWFPVSFKADKIWGDQGKTELTIEEIDG